MLAIGTGAYRDEGEYAGELRCSFAQYLETGVVGICLTQIAPICSMRAWQKNTLET